MKHLPSALATLVAALALCLLASTALAQDAASPVTLKYGYQPGQTLHYGFSVSQDSRVTLPPQPEAQLEARVQAQAKVDVGQASKPGEMALDVRFSGFEVSLKSNGEELQGQEFTSQLGEMRLSVVQTASGKRLRSIVAGGNPQIKRTASLLEDAAMRSFPKLPEEPTKVGASWEDRAEAPKGALQGEVIRRYTLREVKGQVAVLDVVLEADLRGSAGGQEQVYKLQGKGEVRMTLKDGLVQLSTLDYTTVSKPAKDDAQSWSRQARTQIELKLQDKPTP
jgi:opacity protein-like surface antigen